MSPAWNKSGSKRVRLAASPVPWFGWNVDVHPSASSIVTCLADIEMGGFAGVEATPVFPGAGREQVSRRLEKAGLDVSSGIWQGRLAASSVQDELDRLGELLESLAAGEVTSLCYVESGLRDINDEDSIKERHVLEGGKEMRDYASRLSNLARQVRRQGVRLCVEPQLGSLLQTANEVNSLLLATGNEIGLVLDTAHSLLVGEDWSRVLRRHGPRVGYVRCRDLRSGNLEVSREEGWSAKRLEVEEVFTVPGKGMLDFERTFKFLASIKYSGWIAVSTGESVSAKSPLDEVIYGREHIEPLLDQCRFTVVDEGKA